MGVKGKKIYKREKRSKRDLDFLCIVSDNSVSGGQRDGVHPFFLSQGTCISASVETKRTGWPCRCDVGEQDVANKPE